MSYESAPQTKMLATHCVMCGKELCDAESVEAGIGPICRKKSGYHSVCTEENRKAANKLIHSVSCSTDVDAKIAAMTELMEMGFSGVVQAILKSVAAVIIALTEDGRYAVKTPYRPDVVCAMREIKGRRWVKASKVNTFPADQKVALFQMLIQKFEGEIGVGPKGIFKLTMPKKAVA